MAASRAKKQQTIDPAALELELERVRQRLLAEGGVKLSSLRPKPMRDALVPRLVGEGFELNKTWLRRPLAVQLEAALAQGAMPARKALAQLVRGASASELQQALKDAEGRGNVRRVLRGKSEVFTGPDVAVLGARQIVELGKLLGALGGVLAKAAKSKGLSLLLDDVDEALRVAQQLLTRPASEPVVAAVPADAAPEHPVDALLAAVDASRDERSGLSFVPSVVDRLLPRMTLAVAHDVLLTAARRELIELRPEGGLGRLTADEISQCPPGPGGTRLSWARRLAEDVR